MSKLQVIERRILQLHILALAATCLIPGGAGTFGGLNLSSALSGGESLFDGESVLRGFTDNQFRFAFGIFFAQGITLLYILPKVESRLHLFRFVALALFIGGIGRLLNIVEYGVVDSVIVGPTVVELVLVPIMALWQTRISKFLS